MTIAECLKNWDDESTLKWILSRGVSPNKWKAYALHAGVVDGRRWTYEEIAYNGKIAFGKTRARFSQIMKEVESALTREIPFSPHDKRCRLAVNNFLSWIRPERATSAYRLSLQGVHVLEGRRSHEDVTFVCGEKEWRYCGESACKVMGSFMSYRFFHDFDPPLSMDLSWIGDNRNLMPYRAVPQYAVIWCTAKSDVGSLYIDSVYKSRYWLLVFNCDGVVYEFDHSENCSGGLTKVFVKPLECKVIRRF